MKNEIRNSTDIAEIGHISTTELIHDLLMLYASCANISHSIEAGVLAGHSKEFLERELERGRVVLDLIVAELARRGITKEQIGLDDLEPGGKDV